MTVPETAKVIAKNSKSQCQKQHRSVPRTAKVSAKNSKSQCQEEQKSVPEPAKKSTVAGWREFRDNPLPCVGLLETTDGFTPFTGRRHRTRPAVAVNISTDDAVTAVRDNHGEQQLLKFEASQTDCQQILLLGQESHSEETEDADNFESNKTCIFSRGSSRPSDFQNQKLGASSDDFSSLRLLRPQGANNFTLRGHLHCTTSELCPDFSEKPLSLSLSLHVQSPKMTNHLINSPPHFPFATSNPSSLFTITPRDATYLVRSVQKDSDSRHCYFIHLRLHPLFGDDVIPGTCLRKLPRIINGIPLGPGFLSRDQISEIKWRLVEGGHSNLTFISCPLLKQEAEECKTSLKERLMKHAQAVFGDLTVKVGVILSKCLEFDDDFTLNDVAVEFDEGLQFRD